MTNPRYISSKLRDLVAKRANFVCEYCKAQEDFSADSFSVEHIKPIILGGQTIAENLAYSCLGCNSHKSIKIQAIDPISEQIFSLFNPRTQIWHEHFTWNKKFTEIIGLTPIGRATIKTLKLNRKGLINLRWALFAVGKHPPK